MTTENEADGAIRTARPRKAPARPSAADGGADPEGAERERGPLDDSVYESIKLMILKSQLWPAQQLKHQHLADRLEVSRTPVRQALERLYQEGYVIRIPDRGYFVAEIKSHEARDLYQMRLALEPFAIRLSLTLGIGDEQLVRLRALQDVYAERVGDHSMAERVLADQDFHIHLASLSRNDHLVNTLRSVFERLNLNRRIVGYWPGQGNRGAAGVREHELLLDAIRLGRSADAQAILLAHIQEAWVHFEAHLLKIKVG